MGITCPECEGTGGYVGFTVVERCVVCLGHRENIPLEWKSGIKLSHEDFLFFCKLWWAEWGPYYIANHRYSGYEDTMYIELRTGPLPLRGEKQRTKRGNFSTVDFPSLIGRWKLEPV